MSKWRIVEMIVTFCGHSDVEDVATLEHTHLNGFFV